MVPKPRLCTLIKQSPHDEYGFNLHAERGRGHYIGIVDDDGIADFAGLQAGQRLVGVNGQLIYSTTTHREVLELIRKDPLRVELLLASEDIDRWHVENEIPYSYENHIIFHTNYNNGGDKHDPYPTRREEQKSGAIPHHQYSERSRNHRHPSDTNGGPGRAEEAMKILATRSNGSRNHPLQHQVMPPVPPADYPINGMIPRPRLCILSKPHPAEEYGFNLHAERGKGHFIGAVDRDGIADRAGLETGQRIVGVNGQLIYPSTAHKEVVALIKRDPLATELLVANEEVDRWHSDNRLPYTYDSYEQAPVRASPTQYSSGKQSPSSNTHHNNHHHSNNNNHHIQAPPTKPSRELDRPAETAHRNMEDKRQPSSNHSQHSSYSSTSSSHFPALNGHHHTETTATAVADPISIEVNRSPSNSTTSSHHLKGEERAPHEDLSRMAINGPGMSINELQPVKELGFEKYVIASYSPPPAQISSQQLPVSILAGTDRGIASAYSNGTKQAPFTVSPPQPSKGSTSTRNGQSSADTLSSPGSGFSSNSGGNIDIFNMKPRDVQQLIAKRKRDPRLHSTMSFEQKHLVIDNL